MQLKILLLVMASFTALSLNALADGEASITRAKIAELSTHRIERLVSLGRLDEGFLKNLVRVEEIPVPSGIVAKYSMKIDLVPGKAGDGTLASKSIEIDFAEDGKALKDVRLNPGPEPEKAPLWTAKDAATLMESALHYVIENGPTKPEIKVFNEAFTKISLSQETTDTGVVVASGLVEAEGTKEKLQILVALDGTFISARLLPE